MKKKTPMATKAELLSVISGESVSDTNSRKQTLLSIITGGQPITPTTPAVSEAPVIPEQKGFFRTLGGKLGEGLKSFGRKAISGAAGLIKGEFSTKEVGRTALDVGKKALTEFAPEFVRSPLRFATEATATALGQKTDIKFRELFGEEAGSVIEQIYGRPQVRPFGKQIETGREFVSALGGTEEQKKLLPPAFIAVGGLLDFYAKPVKQVFTAIAKETSEQAIETILKNEIKGLADDTAKAWARDLKEIGDPEKVVAYVKQKTKELGEVAAKEATQATPDLQPLAQEAPELFKNQAVKMPETTPTARQSALAEFDQAEQLRRLEPTPKISEPPKLEKLTSETLDQPYTQSTREAIVATAEQIDESPTIVSRVTDALRRTKVALVEYVQGADVRVKQLTELKGVKLDDASDPYLKMTLYPGRVGAKVEALNAETKSIIDDMKKAATELKTDLASIRKQVSDYLYFRHAPERNLALGENAAGITTQKAKEGLKLIESSPNNQWVKVIADRLQKVNDRTLDILHESGVISDDLYKTLRTKYKTHVPLNRIFEETDDVGQILSGRGFDVRGTGIKRAVGSERAVDDIVINILTNHEQAILRAEKNIVDQSTLAFVRKNKDILGNLIEEIHPKAIGKTFEGKPILQQTQDPTILQLFEKGKPVWLKINNPNLAIALRGVGKEKLGVLLNTVATFTRFYSGLATRFNPEFFLPNKIRDLQEMVVFLASQKQIGFKGAVGAASRDLSSIKDVTDAIRGLDTEGAKLYREMKELGGTTGGLGLSTRRQTALSLSSLEKTAESKTRQIGSKLVEYVDDWNTIFEDSTRLSVYKQALKQGLSKDRAAALAKESTINFNRMGKGGPVINALWMFSNASIQGSAKMIRALRNPKVLGATVLTIGGSVAAVNEYNDKADPKWRNKVSKWDRLNGLPVVLPSTDEKFRYFTIPVSWGLKPIKVMTEYAYDAISGQEFNGKEMIENSIVAIMEGYNPVGGTDIISALVPTILDVPVDITRNRSWAGNKIRPDSDPNAPRDVQYFQSLGKTKIGQVSINISEGLQEKIGLAVSPADIKYAFEQYVSGAGRTAGKFINVISSAVDKEPLPLDEYPLISRFYRERTAEEVGAGAGGGIDQLKDILEVQSRERFNLKQQAIELDKELQQLSPETANLRFRQIKQENPQLAEKLKDIISERKLGLAFEEKLMKQLGVENGERARYIDAQIMKLPPERRKDYYNELRQKKIISDEVAKQINKIAKSRQRR
jgi:hypothetical protein